MSPRHVAVLVLVLASAAPAWTQAPQRASVTIYSHDLAFVRESRSLTVRSSRDTVRLGQIPERIDPSSVRLVPGGKARVTRLAYQFDVASGDRLLEHAQGRRVRITMRENRVLEGTLVGADGAWLVVRGDDGGLETLARGSVDGVRLAEPPRGLAFEPTLEAVIEGGAGRADAELSYLTGGLSWGAEHRVVRTGEKTAEWSTMVTVENTSGRSFDVPRLALVAGEPHRVGPSPPPPMPVMRAMALGTAEAKSADLDEQSFGEYHLYTLDRPALLRDRETQMLSMVEARTVQAAPRYLARPGAGVMSQLEIRNTEAAGLGVPLPAGRVRFYERDSGGEVRFTGETTIRHTPEGEKLTLDVGAAFDLVAERREVYNKRISDREREVQIEVKLRNRKKTPVTVVVQEPVSGDNEVIQKSHEPRRVDANTLEFDVPVAAGKEQVLTYTVRLRY
jgi:hypothetical protein